MGDVVLYERVVKVGLITLNRPSVLNAINDALIHDLIGAARAASNEPSVRVVVLRGAGRAFCAGADLKEAAANEGRFDDQVHRAHAEQELAQTMRRMGKPLVAQVHGYALGGGCELAMLADMRIAAEGTRFGFPEIAMGAMVTTGGHYNLARIVGLARAFELLYAGEMIDATQAETIGLINHVVPGRDLERFTEQFANRIAKQPPLELALTRNLLYGAADLHFDAALDEEMHAELLSLARGARRKGMLTAIERIRVSKSRVSQ